MREERPPSTALEGSASPTLRSSQISSPQVLRQSPAVEEEHECSRSEIWSKYSGEHPGYSEPGERLGVYTNLQGKANCAPGARYDARKAPACTVLGRFAGFDTKGVNRLLVGCEEFQPAWELVAHRVGSGFDGRAARRRAFEVWRV